MAGPGFAALSPEERQKMAKKAARASKRSGKAHRWTPESAREASRRGHEARWGKKNEEAA